MKWYKYYVEYEPGDIRHIEENYHAWEELPSSHLLDMRLDFERACRYVGCWGKFLKQGEVYREGFIYKTGMIPDWLIYKMCDYLNGRL